MTFSNHRILVATLFVLATQSAFGTTIIQKGIYKNPKVTGIYVYDVQYVNGNLARFSYIRCQYPSIESVNGAAVLRYDICATDRTNPLDITLYCNDDFCTNTRDFNTEMSVLDINTLHETNSRYPAVSDFLTFCPEMKFRYN